MSGALTLRSRLLLLWLFTLTVCGVLAFIIRDVYELGAQAQTERSVATAGQACASLQAQYARALRPGADPIDPALMTALLNLVLGEIPGMEGGFWEKDRGSVAYAFPTHTGSAEKKDIPSTERARIEALVQQALAAAAPVTDLVTGRRETVVLSACPAGIAAGEIGVWTMARVPIALGSAYDEVKRGLALLLAFVVLSGAWLAFSFYRWGHQFKRIERELGADPRAGARPVTRTGDAELDRVVTAINGYQARLEAAQASARDLGARLRHAERFADLGRVAAAVAHEVRNPLAAIRLKVDNALSASGREREALAFVLQEVDRLDDTVGELLRKARPIALHVREIAVADWLAEHVQGFGERATAGGVALTTQADAATTTFDPAALGRALDNLIANALQHTPREGRIDVSAQLDAGTRVLRVRVTDTGPGVAPEVEPRLFEPFVSGRASGAGLGLALAREIAVAHGGTARHLRHCAGACFELEIPWRAS